MIKKTAYSGIFIAISLILPMITGHIPEIGSMLCPMHIPILLCGFVCGPKYGAMSGFIAPLLKTAIFSVPPLYPTSIGMSLELLTYGLIAGLLYNLLSENLTNIYLSLIGAMITGRIVYGLSMSIMLGVETYNLERFISGTIIGSLPGIIVQLIIIPILVVTINKLKIKTY